VKYRNVLFTHTPADHPAAAQDLGPGHAGSAIRVRKIFLRVLPTLAQIEPQYGDRVQLVFRDYPIDHLHPGARKTHEAARSV
jgi:hypothetical protein